MRSIWKGAISFGLVHIPVKLYPATESRDVHFRLLHRECHTPISFRKVCPTCRREAAPEEIARGYEYSPGHYVVVEEEDLRALPLPTGRVVEILDFIRLEEIDPVFFEKAYYLEPAEGGARAYTLLRLALEKTRRIALARVALRHKESLAAIRVFRGAAPSPDAESGSNGLPPILALETMLFPDEIRSHLGLAEATRKVEVGEREEALALQLVESLAAPFRPEEYRDRYREALLELIEKKVEGKELVAPPPEPTRVIDLMKALEESLRLAEERRQRLRAAEAGVR
jgi:DNA end-binding protein Ku